MESKTKLEAALDELIAGKSTAEIVGPDGLLKQLTKALLNRSTWTAGHRTAIKGSIERPHACARCPARNVV